MAVNNLTDKCTNYGDEDESGKKRSTLKLNVNTDGYPVKPKHFNIDEDRVKYAIRQLKGIKLFMGDLKEINNDLRKKPEIASLFTNYK